MNALASLMVIASTAFGQSDPGTIVVAGDDLAPITFSFSAGTPYRLSYPTARESLWFDRAMTRPAQVSTTYTAVSKGDFNADHILDGRDVPYFITTIVSGPYNAEGDFNLDSAVNLSDIPFFVEAAVGGYPAEGAVLYVQGLSASAAIGDGAVGLLTDPNHTSTFTLAQTDIVTVVSLSISPLSGGVGTPITFTLAPALSPLVFDATTSASWTGVYAPLSGQPSSEFSVWFNGDQVHEQTAGTGIVFVGDGRAQSLPGTGGLGGPGVLNGQITLRFGGHEVRKACAFVPTDPAFLAHVTYLDTSTVSGPPTLGDRITELPILYVNTDTNEPPTLEDVQAAKWAHLVPVVYVEESTGTTAAAPMSLSVRIVVVDQNDQVLDQTPVIAMTKAANDGDPQHIIYYANVYTPTVLSDALLNPVDFPEFHVLNYPPEADAVRVIPAN